MLQQELVHFSVFWLGAKGDFRHLQLGPDHRWYNPTQKGSSKNTVSFAPFFCMTNTPSQKTAKKGRPRKAGY